MRKSQRTKKILKNLDSLALHLAYFSNNNEEYSHQFNEIRRLIEELADDSKDHDLRLAKKLKYLWESSKTSKN